MNTLCYVTAQYYENYGGDSTSPHWKQKGGQIFKLYVDSDDFFYGEEHCIKAIKECLHNQSGSKYKYEYLSHELIFNEPVELNGFQNALNKQLENL